MAPTPAFGGFGAAATTSAPAYGFGQQQSTTTTGFSGFGNTTGTTAQAPAFGGFGATQAAPAFGGFGTQATQPAAGGLSFGGFGANTSLATSTAPSFGGFNTTNSGFGGFGQQQPFGQLQQQQQQQQPVPSAEDIFAQAIFKVNIFGDERDTTIARWNYIQAMWGTGKAFYSQSAAPVEVTPSNYLNRFKAMGYSKLQGKDNKMGLVALVFNKPQTQVK